MKGKCERGLMRVQMLKTNVSRKDQGAYRCEVEFEDYKVEKTIQLLVKPTGEWGSGNEFGTHGFLVCPSKITLWE